MNKIESMEEKILMKKFLNKRWEKMFLKENHGKGLKIERENKLQSNHLTTRINKIFSD